MLQDEKEHVLSGKVKYCERITAAYVLVFEVPEYYSTV